MALTSTGRKIEHNKVVDDTQFEAVKLPISGHKRGMKGCGSILVVSICLLYAYTNRNYQYISNPGLVYHN